MFSTQFVVLSFLVLVAPRKTRAFVVTVDVTPHGKPLWTRASDAPLISSDLQHDTCDEYHHESLVYLRQHYRNLWQHQLTADEAYEHAADLVDIALQLTAAARLERESQAAAAHDAMQRAVRECQRVGVLREQAQRETAWAVQDAAGPDALQEALLARAARDVHRVESQWQQADARRQAALQTEVQVKDSLWTLVQREETLQALQQDGHDAEALRAWIQHELAHYRGSVHDDDQHAVVPE